jgi:hypothetical protein
MNSADLVERLRHADTHSQQRVMGSRIFGEAADLIAALERQLAEARAEAERWAAQALKEEECRIAWQAERDRLAADNARLRERENAAREFVKRHPALTLIDLAEFEAFLKIPETLDAFAGKE